MTKHRSFSACLVGLVLVAIAATAIEAFFLAPVSRVGWMAQGSFTRGGEYPTTDLRTVRGAHWGSWSGNDANIGTLTSEPFPGPPVIALRVAGGTTNPDETIRVERLDTGDTLSITTPTDAGETYVIATQALPFSWWTKQVRIVAEDRGGGGRGWLGVADLHAAGLLDLLDRWAQLQMFAFILAQALILVIPAVVCGYEVARRLRVAEVLAFPIGLVLLGLMAEAVFFLGRFAGPAVGIAITWACCIGLIGTAIAVGRRTASIRQVDVWAPVAIATGAAVVYGIILVAGPLISNSLPSTAEGRWFSLPPDNFLPGMLANQVIHHLPPRPFLAEWLSSDSPPLQAGFHIIAAWLFPNDGWQDARYEAVGLFVQSWALAALWPVARVLGFSKRRTLAAIALCVPSGFFLLNTVFVWPKLIAAAYGLAAAAIGLPLRERPQVSLYAIAGVSFGLGMLCHAGVAFTLPMLMVAVLMVARRSAVVPLCASVAAILVVSAPWTAYQKFYDPPGDRLVKWHLGAQIAPDPNESVSRVVLRAYETTPAARILMNKWENLRTVVSPVYGSRAGEFFFVLPALGTLAVPLVWSLLLRGRTTENRNIRGMAWIGVGSIVVWCLMMWTYAVVHQGSYLTLVLLYFASALTATRSAIVAAYIALAQSLIFADFWLYGLVATPVIDLLGVVAISCALLGLYRGQRSGSSAVAWADSHARGFVRPSKRDRKPRADAQLH